MRTSLRALLASAALAATVAIAAPAAALSLTLYPNDQPLPAEQVMIADFDSPIAAGFLFTQNIGAFVRSGSEGLASGVSAPPPGDVSNYETVLGGGLATLTTTSLLSSFSFFLGSPDTYNTVKFYGLNGYQVTLSGQDILGPSGVENGDQTFGRRVSYDFGANRVNKIEFISGGNSFEFDSLAGSIRDAVPEPATWTMLILGFGAVGAMLRRRQHGFTPA